MRAILAACVVLVVLAIASGCADSRQPPVVSGPIAIAPPASGGLTTTTEFVNTSHANAVASGVRSAIVATETLQVDNTKSSQQASIGLLLPVGILVAALGGFILYEGSKKIGMGLIVSGIGLSFAEMILTALIPYEGRIAAAAAIAGICCLAYHNRSLLKDALVKAEEDAIAAGRVIAAHAEALEQSIARNKEFVYLEGKAGEVMGAAWHKAESETERIAALMERKKPAAPAVIVTANTTATPPTVK